MNHVYCFSSLSLYSTTRPQSSTFGTNQRLLANIRYGVFSPRKIFSYLAWITRLACKTLRAWVSYLVYRVLLARKLLLIALILGLFASVAVSIQCTNQYPQLSSQLEKYIHTNRNSSAQLDASALRYQDLEEQTLGLSKKAGMRDIFPVRERTQTNWLSPLVGATIIPELCSPPSPPKEFKFDYSNLEKPENLTNQETYKSQFQINSGPSAPGPATALLPWKEAERRYCVPEGQLLQLGVSSPRNILPTSLIIEHWRMGEVPGSLMRRAPKDVELWTYIRAEDDAAKVRDEALTNYPGLTTKSSQQNESLHPKQILTFPWIPIGVFRYEIDTVRNVQEFRIDYDLEIPMEHFAIRVISNWGHVGETCLVRVRLHGEVMDRKKGVKEKVLFW